MDVLILARHGESTYSAVGRCSGDPTIPVPLTVHGQEQAEALRRQLRGRSIDLCVTSEFERTQQTADIALGEQIVPRLILPQLNDIAYGIFEGQSHDSYAHWVDEHGDNVAIPDGESKLDVARRVAAALRLLLERTESTILVVTHEAVIKAALRAAGLAPEHIEYATPYTLPAAQTKQALAAIVARVADRGED